MNEKKPFTFSADNSRWTYSYDPGCYYGPPENCYPSSLEIEDYIDGGIEIYYDGELAASLICNMDDIDVDLSDTYAYGNEEAYSDSMEYFIDVFNNVMECINNGKTFTDEDDEDIFCDVSSWEELLCYDEFHNWECEIYEPMPDFEAVIAMRQ